jgi:2-C-methyl-D-erythritol 4-phosphate cytidylyltransferase
MKSSLPKTLMPFRGRPLFLASLGLFEELACVESVILVCAEQYLEEFWEGSRSAGFRKVNTVVAGGVLRSDSVALGLAQLDSDTTHVVVHDGARPFFCKDSFMEGVTMSRKYPAVIFAVPIKPTIKDVDPKTLLVRSTLNRENLWEAQTPQIFEKTVLVNAHAQNHGGQPTDDAMLVEQLGIPVRVYLGDYRNIKITTPEDWILAEQSFKDL